MRALSNIAFKRYRRSNYDACMVLFDANCPRYFAANERDEYAGFLAGCPSGYEICEWNSKLCGAFGLTQGGTQEARLNWILLDPDAQGMGIGSTIMRRILDASRASGATTLGIATSQHVAAFFEKFGAAVTATAPEGFGPGLDRVDMVIRL